MNKQIEHNVSVYLPQTLSEELSVHECFIKYKDKVTQNQLSKSWQSLFCDEIGYSKEDLPWNHLRASQFDISPEYKTLVCCDPVIMQMTHRGAYLWGQQQITFSKEEAIRIVAQINQQLMSDNECFYLLNNSQWLYANKNALKLNQQSFEEYIGKDMFGFSYQGRDGSYWQKLATEIQMLIKQMMDYQDLPSVAPETLVNVFFWGDSDSYVSGEIEVKDVKIYTSDELVEKFCLDSNLTYDNIEQFLIGTNSNNSKRTIILDSKKVISDELLTKVFALYESGSCGSLKITTQDKQFEMTKQRSLWQKLRNLLD